MDGGGSHNYYCLCGEAREICKGQCPAAKAFQAELRGGRANQAEFTTRLEFCKGPDFTEDGREFYNMWIEMRPMQRVLCSFDPDMIRDYPDDIEQIGLMVCLIFNHYSKTAQDEDKKIRQVVTAVNTFTAA